MRNKYAFSLECVPKYYFLISQPHVKTDGQEIIYSFMLENFVCLYKPMKTQLMYNSFSLFTAFLESEKKKWIQLTKKIHNIQQQVRKCRP